MCACICAFACVCLSEAGEFTVRKGSGTAQNGEQERGETSLTSVSDRVHFHGACLLGVGRDVSRSSLIGP